MPEIEVRPAIEADIPTLVKIDHSYTSDHVWQMDPFFAPLSPSPPIFIRSLENLFWGPGGSLFRGTGWLYQFG
jgi:hypothetical protein